MSRTVYIEESRTPIYRRIAYALGAELTRCGAEVFAVKPEGFNSASFQEFVAKQGAATYVSNSGRNSAKNVGASVASGSLAIFDRASTRCSKTASCAATLMP